MKSNLLLGLLFALVAVVTGCTDAPVGSKSRPFTMYFVPSVDAEAIATTAKSMTDFLQKSVSQKLYGKDKGFYVRSDVPTSYIAVVEAFGTGKADFAAFNTFSYILAKDIKKYDIEALLTVVRGTGETTYKGQIITRTDSGIDKLEDLTGKKFAYTDPASTSGFILPSKLLAEKGIQLGEVVFAQKHDNVVTMVYQRQVDAGATFYSPPRVEEVEGKQVEIIRDARGRVKTQFPDVEEKVKILDFTMEIPNEPWVIRRNMLKDPAQNEKLKTAVREALMAYSQTSEGQKFMKETYDVKGLQTVTDNTYAQIRKLVASTDINLEQIVGKKKAKKKK